jgi:SAM-dependent methyltransferase
VRRTDNPGCLLAPKRQNRGCRRAFIVVYRSTSGKVIIELEESPHRRGLIYNNLFVSHFWSHGRTSLARRFNVDLTHAQTVYGRVLDEYVTPGIRWLDIGCGRQVVPSWAMSTRRQSDMISRSSLFVGIDVDHAILEHALLRHRVIAIGDNLPFRSGSFDLITSNMVVEHLANPGLVLRNIHLALRRGGRFLFHTVNQNSLMRLATFMPDGMKKQLAWKLESRLPEDVFPTHYRLNSRDAVVNAAEAEGFAVERIDILASSGFLGRFGILGAIEVPLLKLMSHGAPLHHNGPNLLVSLRRA